MLIRTAIGKRAAQTTLALVASALCFWPAYSGAQASQALLIERMKLWSEHAATCGGHPTKVHADQQDPTKLVEAEESACSDGDMTLFSGLLCAAGVKDSAGKLVGCNAVKAAQDADGRFHRSPRRRLFPSIAEGEKKDNVASFSPDMAIGTQLYFAKSRDMLSGAASFRWYDEHRPCWAGNEPGCSALGQTNIRGMPRFCTDSPGPVQPDETDLDKALRKLGIDPRCSMRPGDLAVLAKTRAWLKVYKFSPKDTQSCQPPAASSWDDAKKRFDNLERLLNLTRLENLLAVVAGGLPYTLQLSCAEAATWVRIGAEFNKKGYSQHLVAVQILLLRMLGENNGLLDESALRLAQKEPENPFFLFLSQGKSQAVLDKIIQHCPNDKVSAEKSKRSEWMWEREHGKDWNDTSSMWDCLFVGQLWLSK